MIFLKISGHDRFSRFSVYWIQTEKQSTYMEFLNLFIFCLYFPRSRGPGKRSRSTVSPQCISRQQQLNKSIELSKPKPRGGVNPSLGSHITPGPPGKGPRIVKPVSRCVLKRPFAYLGSLFYFAKTTVA